MFYCRDINVFFNGKKFKKPPPKITNTTHSKQFLIKVNVLMCEQLKISRCSVSTKEHLRLKRSEFYGNRVTFKHIWSLVTHINHRMNCSRLVSSCSPSWYQTEGRVPETGQVSELTRLVLIIWPVMVSENQNTFLYSLLIAPAFYGLSPSSCNNYSWSSWNIYLFCSAKLWWWKPECWT